MTKGFFAYLTAALVLSTSAQADNYKIAVPGSLSDPQAEAVLLFEQGLAVQSPDTRLEVIFGLGRARDLPGYLEEGFVDIAVVPFEAVPALRQSPLLEPFLARSATEIRQAIDSEVGAFEKTDVEDEGFRVLDFWHVSSSIFGSRVPVTTVADLQGLRIYDGGRPRDDTLLALGAAPTQLAFAEVINALQAGAVDSSAVPLDNRNVELGFAGVVQNYVDRLYRPRLYAVLVSQDRWNETPFADQHYLAKVAEDVGQALVGSLEDQAAQFRIDELARGSNFNAWDDGDVVLVRQASLNTVELEAVVERQLINLAYDSAASPPAPVPDSEPRPAAEVRLLFATDRVPADLSNPATAFSSRRLLRGHIFGVADIDLEDGRQFGDDLEDVSRITGLSELIAADFWAQVSANSGKQFVLFVHGYNNAFTDSIRRGATIQQDVAQDSIVISYTWPSDGQLLSYGYDEASTDTAEQNFKLFMDDLVAILPSGEVSVIAHSMGSRLLTKYLAGLPERGIRPEDVKFENIVFAAPDISTDFFRQKEEVPFNPALPLSEYAERVTIYSSQFDRPLGLSQKLHRDQRLGLADEASIFLDEDIVAIDASKIDPARWYQKFSFATRHSYVFDKAAGVRDLALLLVGAMPGDRPGMVQRSRGELVFWQLHP